MTKLGSPAFTMPPGADEPSQLVLGRSSIIISSCLGRSSSPPLLFLLSQLSGGHLPCATTAYCILANNTTAYHPSSQDFGRPPVLQLVSCSSQPRRLPNKRHFANPSIAFFTGVMWMPLASVGCEKWYVPSSWHVLTVLTSLCVLLLARLHSYPAIHPYPTAYRTPPFSDPPHDPVLKSMKAP